MKILDLIKELKSYGEADELLKGVIGGGDVLYIDMLGNLDGDNIELGLSDDLPLPKPKYKSVLLSELSNHVPYEIFNDENNNIFLSNIIEHQDESYDIHYHAVMGVIESDDYLVIKADKKDVIEMKQSYPAFDESLYDYSEDDD